MKILFCTRMASAVTALTLCVASIADPLNPTLKVGDPAPKLDVMAWLKGEPVTSFEPEHVYVIDFWATWCVPCIEAMPHMSELQKKYADRLTVIGVSVREVDHGNAAPDVSVVKKFVEKKGDVMGYTVAMDDPVKNPVFDAWMTAAGVYGIPTVFIVDGQGRMVWVGPPNGPWKKDFDAAVEQALERKSDLDAARTVQDRLNEQTYMRLTR